MGKVPDQSVNLVCADLPYGSTACKWDQRISLQGLWVAYQRVLEPRGAIVLTADMRFACDLIATCPKGWFRYDLVWDKIGSTGYLDANRRPLRRHELVLVFSPKGYPTYNPQMANGEPYVNLRKGNASVYGKHIRTDKLNNTGVRYPTSIVSISNSNSKERGKVHPTQKPTGLTDWLIKTFSNIGDTVLDNAMGSATTGVSALTLGRNFIGIEKDPTYFEMAKERLKEWNV